MKLTLPVPLRDRKLNKKENIAGEEKQYERAGEEEQCKGKIETRRDQNCWVKSSRVCI